MMCYLFAKVIKLTQNITDRASFQLHLEKVKAYKCSCIGEFLYRFTLIKHTPHQVYTYSFSDYSSVSYSMN